MRAADVKDDYVVTYGDTTIRVNLITHVWDRFGNIAKVNLIDDNYRRHTFNPNDEVHVA
jgi:hypothetical protein